MSKTYHIVKTQAVGNSPYIYLGTTKVKPKARNNHYNTEEHGYSAKPLNVRFVNFICDIDILKTRPKQHKDNYLSKREEKLLEAIETHLLKEFIDKV